MTIIQHNLPALNSHRNMGKTNNNLSKNLEKLSSGFRINRAGDDAAGLGISEKMRAQITGLETAAKNAQDGISLVQTAEGALQEMHSMLDRLIELSTQSANGTYDDAVDRSNLQKECEAIKSEIDRVAKSSNFNGIKLLDGSLGSGSGTGVPGAPNVELSSKMIGDGVYGYEGSKKGDYTTATFSAANIDGANTGLSDICDVGNTFIVKITYEDKNSCKQTIEVSLKVTKDDTGALKLQGENGLLHDLDIGITTPDGDAQKSLQNALMREISLRTPLADSFKMETASGGGIQFIAKEGGTDTLQLEMMRLDMFDEYGEITELALGFTVKQQPEDQYEYMDLNDVKADSVWNGSDPSKADVFTVNGEKFALVGSDVTAKQMTALAPDVTAIILSVGGGTKPDPKDADVIAKTIANKTGVSVQSDTTKGTVSFKPLNNDASNSSDGLQLQVGDTSESFQKVTVSIGKMDTSALGIGGIDISTQSGASTAVSKIKTAINTVSSTRGGLGALQNRLEYTINNLRVTSENMTASESRIRDVDMAKEMMGFTKNNILAQANQAMLAQANQMPQGVLQLLQ